MRVLAEPSALAMQWMNRRRRRLRFVLLRLACYFRRVSRPIGEASTFLFYLVRFLLETHKRIQRLPAVLRSSKPSVDVGQNVIIGGGPRIKRNRLVQSFGRIVEPALC